MYFNSTITNHSLSFCVDSSFDTSVLASTFDLSLVLSGTNYASYAFSPSQNITINIVPSTDVPAPSLSL